MTAKTHTGSQASPRPHPGTLARLTLLALGFALATLGTGIIFLFLDPAGVKALPSVTEALANSSVLRLEVIAFLAAFLGAHALLGVGWHFLWQPTGRRLATPRFPEHRLAILAFLPVLAFLLLSNHWLYPRSEFAFGWPSPALETALFAGWLASGGYILAVALFSTGMAARYLFRQYREARSSGIPHIIGALVIAGIAWAAWSLPLSSATSPETGERAQPDIILIGVDSLRNDHVGFMNGHTPSLTPTLDGFLEADAAVAADAWTPLGRSFPAWVSTLTGRYPRTHGAVFNLTHRDRIQDEGSLPRQLGELGYHRIYGIDEARFSNIDAGYGFDEVVAPTIGASDFLIGTIGDLPTVNLLANTNLGRILFPNIHMNRAVYHAYDPDTFPARLDHAITAAPSSEPLFLVAHFELPHWPFRWAYSGKYETERPSGLDAISSESYHKAVARTDEQVDSLLGSLEENGRLDNAIVIVLADHGEAFPGTEPGWQAANDTDASIPAHPFHGTNVLSEAQNQVILGIRGLGPQSKHIKPGIFETPTVSLVDIQPTLHDWLEIPRPDVPLEGRSLLPLLSDRNIDGLASHAVTVESGFSTPTLQGGDAARDAILKEGAGFYEVTPDGRVALRDDALPYLMSRKQRAAIRGRWALGAYPHNREEGEWRLLLADFETHRYWDARQTDSLPENAPVTALFDTLCDRFHGDMGFKLAECGSHIALP